jgi:hypothetical protein
MREAAKLEISEGGGTNEPVIGKGNRTVYVDHGNLRPEARLEDPAHSAANRGETEIARGESTSAPTRPDGSESVREEVPAASPRRDTAKPRRQPAWTEPDVAERPASYAIYRPETGNTTQEPAASPRVRTEAK